MSKKRKRSLDSTQKKTKRKYDAINKGYEKVKSKAKSAVNYSQYIHRIEAKLAILNTPDTTIRNASLEDVKEAVNKINNTATFTTAEERAKTNLLDAMKEKFNDVYHKAIQLSRDEKGHYVGLLQNMVYDKDKEGYIFKSGKKTMFIDIKNSPEEILIYEIQV